MKEGGSEMRGGSHFPGCGGMGPLKGAYHGWREDMIACIGAELDNTSSTYISYAMNSTLDQEDIESSSAS
jgi:hypothetical protein